MEDSGVNGGSKEVVSGSDGMDVTSQVEVEFIHRNDLAVATASSTSFDPESWPLGWLTKARDNLP